MRSRVTPVFNPGRPIKVLVSPGIGAGFITWLGHGSFLHEAENDAYSTWVLTYQPLIDALEVLEAMPDYPEYPEEDVKDEKFDPEKLKAWREAHKEDFKAWNETCEAHSAVVDQAFDRLREEAASVWSKEGNDLPYKQGMLRVVEVEGPFFITEYDGHEELVEISKQRVIDMAVNASR